MTRQLTDHESNQANKNLVINVLDEPGQGGACHAYGIKGHDETRNPFFTGERKVEWCEERLIVFQNGPIAKVGVNGITHEALLAILIDRLRLFQSGKYACRENALALTKIEEALHWLNSRTRSRIERGVEGTDQV